MNDIVETTTNRRATDAAGVRTNNRFESDDVNDATNNASISEGRKGKSKKSKSKRQLLAETDVLDTSKADSSNHFNIVSNTNEMVGMSTKSLAPFVLSTVGGITVTIVPKSKKSITTTTTTSTGTSSTGRSKTPTTRSSRTATTTNCIDETDDVVLDTSPKKMKKKKSKKNLYDDSIIAPIDISTTSDTIATSQYGSDPVQQSHDAIEVVVPSQSSPGKIKKKKSTNNILVHDEKNSGILPVPLTTSEIELDNSNSIHIPVQNDVIVVSSPVKMKKKKSKKNLYDNSTIIETGTENNNNNNTNDTSINKQKQQQDTSTDVYSALNETVHTVSPGKLLKKKKSKKNVYDNNNNNNNITDISTAMLENNTVIQTATTDMEHTTDGTTTTEDITTSPTKLKKKKSKKHLYDNVPDTENDNIISDTAAKCVSTSTVQNNTIESSPKKKTSKRGTTTTSSPTKRRISKDELLSLISASLVDTLSKSTHQHQHQQQQQQQQQQEQNINKDEQQLRRRQSSKHKGGICLDEVDDDNDDNKNDSKGNVTNQNELLSLISTSLADTLSKGIDGILLDTINNDNDVADETIDATISPSKSRRKTKISSDQILALLGPSIVQSIQNSTNLQQQIPPASTKIVSTRNETEAISIMTDGNDSISHAVSVETSKKKKKNKLVSSPEMTTNKEKCNDIETTTTDVRVKTQENTEQLPIEQQTMIVDTTLCSFQEQMKNVAERNRPKRYESKSLAQATTLADRMKFLGTQLSIDSSHSSSPTRHSKKVQATQILQDDNNDSINNLHQESIRNQNTIQENGDEIVSPTRGSTKLKRYESSSLANVAPISARLKVFDVSESGKSYQVPLPPPNSWTLSPTKKHSSSNSSSPSKKTQIGTSMNTKLLNTAINNIPDLSLGDAANNESIDSLNKVRESKNQLKTQAQASNEVVKTEIDPNFSQQNHTSCSMVTEDPTKSNDKKKKKKRDNDRPNLKIVIPSSPEQSNDNTVNALPVECTTDNALVKTANDGMTLNGQFVMKGMADTDVQGGHKEEHDDNFFENGLLSYQEQRKQMKERNMKRYESSSLAQVIPIAERLRHLSLSTGIVSEDREKSVHAGNNKDYRSENDLADAQDTTTVLLDRKKLISHIEVDKETSESSSRLSLKESCVTEHCSEKDTERNQHGSSRLSSFHDSTNTDNSNDYDDAADDDENSVTDIFDSKFKEQLRLAAERNRPKRYESGSLAQVASLKNRMKVFSKN